MKVLHILFSLIIAAGLQHFTFVSDKTGTEESLQTAATPEYLNYQVEIKNKVAGSIQVTKERTGYRTYRYKAASFIRHQVVIPVKVEHQFSATYENALLKSASVNIEVNGRSHTESKTLYQGYKVWHFLTGRDREEIHRTIGYSSILLYFHEPEGISEVYSEEDGAFHELQRIGLHSYMKISPKGRKNIYHYQNGILSRAEIDTRAIDFIIRKTET